MCGHSNFSNLNSICSQDTDVYLKIKLLLRSVGVYNHFIIKLKELLCYSEVYHVIITSLGEQIGPLVKRADAVWSDKKALVWFWNSSSWEDDS